MIQVIYTVSNENVKFQPNIPSPLEIKALLLRLGISEICLRLNPKKCREGHIKFSSAKIQIGQMCITFAIK